MLSFLNIKSYYSINNVLGVATKSTESTNDFWSEYLKSNPNYIPGWVEIGRYDKALQIDPNYQIIEALDSTE